MLIKRRSEISGNWHEMELDVTQEQLNEYNNSNRCIQEIFPSLTPDEREFIMTGITKDEWDELFKDAEEEGE